MVDTIKILLRESLLLLENDELSFPEDYTKKTSKKEYVYRMGAMRPQGYDDVWYESKPIVKEYKGIPVKMKHILNKDKSERGWKLIRVGFERDEIKYKGSVPNVKNVRKAIDQYYNDFISYMNQVDASDNELEKIINNKFGDKIKNPYSDSLIETAIRWVLNPKFNLKEKRRVLKHLMNKGLSIKDAIRFWGDIK